MIDELILHGSLEPTGTASLQHSLSRLRPQLARRGVAYLDDSQLAALPSITGWANGAHQRPAEAESFNQELAELIEVATSQAELRSKSAVRMVVLSSDRLLGRRTVGPADADLLRPWAEPAISQLVKASGASSVRIILQIRRQDRLMERCYQDQIRIGGWHEFAEQFPYGERLVLDYRALLARLRAIPGITSLTVQPAELATVSEIAVAQNFLALAGISEPIRLHQGLRNQWTPMPPTAYTALGLTIAVALNQHLDTDVERARVRRFLSNRHPATTDEDARFLPDETRADIVARYRQANEQLFASELPELPADSYSTDAGTEALGLALAEPRATLPEMVVLGSASAAHQVGLALPLARRVPGAVRRRVARMRS